MFRIIAIETLKPQLTIDEKRMMGEKITSIDIAQEERYQSIMKVLKPKQKYYFYEGYTISKGKIKRNKQLIPNDFYRINEANVPSLTVAAIVGENGQGKSSILELLMRILNNASFVLRKGLDKEYRSQLVFVFDIFACVYIEDTDDGHFYQIKQVGDVIFFRDQQDSNKTWTIPAKESETCDAQKCREYLSGLFYSIVINYSNYSFWPEEYRFEWLQSTDEDQYGIKKAENSCWLDSLFNKNDAYQTPIVINPYRNHGTINFRNENELLPERIFALLFNPTSKVSGILNGKSVGGFLLKLRKGLVPSASSMFESEDVLEIVRNTNIVIGNNGAFKSIDDLGNEILNSWGHCYGVDLLPGRTNNRKSWKSETMDVRCAANYIVYKTLKIARKYYAYHDFLRDIDCGNLDKYIHKLYKDNSHITLKVRRCIAFLIFKFYSNFGPSHIKDDNYMSVTDYQKWINNCINGQIDGLPRGRTRKYEECEFHTWNQNEFWPAPCYVMEFILDASTNNDTTLDGDKQGQSYIPFSTLSSGEKHLINIVSSILYHVQNVASRWNVVERVQESCQYRNICIMLDEAELYAHPKYQAKLLSYILKSLEGLNLGENAVTGIQILIATHSPFVLSDIPSCNILSIKDGKPFGKTQDMIGKTFAANVYDILSHKFFMDSFVGEFARAKINNLLKEITNISKNLMSEEEITRLRMAISVIGDDFLRSNIEERLNRAYKKDCTSPSYLDLQNQVEELKQKLSKFEQSK